MYIFENKCIYLNICIYLKIYVYLNIYAYIYCIYLHIFGFVLPHKCPLLTFLEVGDMDYEIQKHNAPGFIGCISGVRYNVYAPLKALFRPNETNPPVTTQGYVSESICGAFPPVLGYVPWEVDPWFTSIGE